MKKSKVYLVLQGAVCCALAALLAASALSIYREGRALRAIDPTASIYTPEIVAERFRPIAPLFVAALVLLVVGLALGIRDEGAERPAKAPGLLPPTPAAPPRRQGAVRAALLIAAAVLIVAGIANGSARDVLYKAITICTECVGLG